MSEVLDLFAGPGGFDLGARELGLDPLGVELDATVCATREAAGLRTLEADVAALDPVWLGPVEGLIASPPCPPFSQAGKRGGERDMAAILEVTAALALEGRDTRAWWRPQLVDERSLLVVEPLRYVLALAPRWIALEQVPPVLAYWRRLADLLAPAGYRAWAGVVNAADYGVPQTRERAILLASRDGRPVGPPWPTHADARRGIPMGFEPWISMAEALGWPASGRTVRTGKNSMSFSRDPQDMIPYERTLAMPAPTLDGNVNAWRVAEKGEHIDPPHRWKIVGAGAQANATERALDEPAPTIHGGKAGGPTWTLERPATTVAGDPRIGRPGHKAREDGEGQFALEAVRVTLAEASVLQGFPADHPWQGTRTAAFGQVGNAVPPPLARRLLEVLVG